MNVALIMRGIPGSGKTTAAKRLAGMSGVIHSTDNYFMVNGEYRFDRSQLQAHHDANFSAFCESLRQGVPLVICDNTNVTKAHYQRYVDAAEQAGYIVTFVIMKHPEPEVAAARNQHGVPLETIKRMIEKWEP